MRKKHFIIPLLPIVFLSLTGCNKHETSVSSSTGHVWRPDTATRTFLDTFAYSNNDGPDNIKANLMVENMGSTDDTINITGLISNVGTATMSIPESVRDLPIVAINEKAFDHRNADDLVTINIPDSLTDIKANAFLNRAGFTNINVSSTSNLSYIGTGAFRGTKFLTDYTASTEPFYLGKVLLYVPKTVSGSFTVKEGTTMIYDEAFKDCLNLASISLPESLRYIGLSAFQNTGITSIKIPDSVNIMGRLSLSDCLNLTKVELPSNDNFSYGTNPNFLKGSINITELVYDGNAELRHVFGLTKLEELSAIPLKKVTIRDNVEHHVVKNALTGLSSIEEIVITQGIKVVEEEAFVGLSKLIRLSYPEDLEFFAAIEIMDSPFYKSLSIQDSIYFGNSLFFVKDGLTNFTFKESVTGIAPEVIKKKLPLKTLPSTIKYIGRSALEGSESLEEINLPSFVRGEKRGFALAAQLKRITLHSNATLLPELFLNCSSIIYLNMGVDVSLKSLFGEVKIVLKDVEEIIIGEGLTEISASAFAGLSDLKNIVIPESVVKIGASAFRDCISLEKIKLHERITSIGNAAFEGCTRLSTAVLDPTTLTRYDNGIIRPLYTLSIGAFAFANTALTEFTITNRVMNVGGAFLFGSKVKQVRIEIDPVYLMDLSFDKFNPLNNRNSMKFSESWNQTDTKDSYGNQDKIGFKAYKSVYPEPKN